jgi:hypothetical protein
MFVLAVEDIFVVSFNFEFPGVSIKYICNGGDCHYFLITIVSKIYFNFQVILGSFA